MRIHFWNLFLSLFYVLLVIAAVSYLAAVGRIFYDIPVRDLVLIALAIFRLTRLFTYDVIMAFVRNWFAGARPDTLRHTLGTLINCPWCTGLWFSLVVLFFYFATIYSWPVILILALASVASFFQILANWVGWSAEKKKLEVQGMQGN